MRAFVLAVALLGLSGCHYWHGHHPYAGGGYHAFDGYRGSGWRDGYGRHGHGHWRGGGHYGRRWGY